MNELTAALGMTADHYPSTGLICLVKMVRRFGAVNIVGFDHFMAGNRHYYEAGARSIPTRHDADRERYWFKLFNQLGLVQYGPGEPSFYKYDGHAANLNP